MNRKHFLKTAGYGLGILPFAPGALYSLADETTVRPNVLIIYTDDQGSIDMNIYGAEDLITPHMDALAREGVRFTQFYAAAPICSPSRAALMTGRYPQRAGLPGNAPGERGFPGMPTDEVTIAELLHEAGYTTGHIGKWHLGFTPETMPNGQGFDYSFGHMGGCIDNYSHYFYWHGPNRHDLFRNGKEVWEEGKFFGDAMVEECKGFLRRNRENPFLLYWAINFPHYPVQGTPKWRERYKDLPMPRREYAAFVSTMDEMIGKVMGELDSLGLREDTIVIFQSDHGHSTEMRAWGGGGDAGPYRGAKGCLFEGGIRIPAIISWPGHLPRNAVRKQMATNCDWFPTIAHYCGVDLPDRIIDGKNLDELIRSDEAGSPHQEFHWEKLDGQWAVRYGKWKLLGNPEDRSRKEQLSELDRRFLVNLEEDVSEMENLAWEHPDLVRKLTDLHDQWRKKVTDRERLNKVIRW